MQHIDDFDRISLRTYRFSLRAETIIRVFHSSKVRKFAERGNHNDVPMDRRGSNVGDGALQRSGRRGR
jgi:hypothetical protein